jgi:hypothetical protein
VRHAGRLLQSIDQPALHALRGREITATMLVRSADGQPAPAASLLRDTAGFSQTPFVAGEQWQQVRVQHTLAMTTTYVRLVVGPGRGVRERNGPTAGGQGSATAVPDQAGSGLRCCATAISAPARLGELLAAPLEDRWRQFAPHAGPDREAAARNLLYLALTFAGFWGNYGWLQAPLPLALYALLALLTAAAGCRGVASALAQDAGCGQSWLPGCWPDVDRCCRPSCP